MMEYTKGRFDQEQVKTEASVQVQKMQMDSVYSRKETSQYYKDQIEYAVVHVLGDELSIVYLYEIPEDENRERLGKSRDDKDACLYPSSYRVVESSDPAYVVSQKAIEDSYRYYHSGGVPPYRRLDDTTSHLMLFVPSLYTHGEIQKETVYDELLPEDVIKRIEKLDFSYPYILVGEDYTKNRGERDDDYLEYYCTSCGRILHIDENEDKSSWRPCCPDCKRKTKNRWGQDDAEVLVSSNFKRFRKEQYKGSPYSSVCFDHYRSLMTTSFYCVEPVEEGRGVVIYKVNRSVQMQGDKVTISFTVPSYIRHIPGGEMGAFRHLKTKDRAADPFEVLLINSKNIETVGKNVIYGGAADFYDFARKNEKFLKMSGFLACLKYSARRLNLKSFFLVFIAIVNKYPILEQIIKMGHAHLFFNLYGRMISAESKADMLLYVDRLGSIVNTESTGGKDALRFPVYIGDYLIRKGAELDEYFYWRDIYELTHISKEQLFELTESFNYAMVNGAVGLRDIGNILKFGYTMPQLLNYVVNTALKTGVGIGDIISRLTDYLNMCDLLQITIDKFPQDLGKQHDDIARLFSEHRKARYDRLLSDIGTSVEAYVNPKPGDVDKIGIPALFKTMLIVCPKSEADFADEGNQQHNCVGAYPRLVKTGMRVVFFIRYRETPKKSFITAECTSSGLGQCYYSNNRPVRDTEMKKFAAYAANRIKEGVRIGRIPALERIPAYY